MSLIIVIINGIYQPLKINAGKSPAYQSKWHSKKKKQVIKLHTKVDRNGDLGKQKHIDAVLYNIISSSTLPSNS